MAQKFTPIVCPQCGSAEHTQLESGKFLCTSCSTVFLEDKEKVEVHVKHSYEGTPNQPVQVTRKTRNRIIAVCIMIPILMSGISIISSTFSRKSPHRSILSADVYDMVNGENQVINADGKLLYAVPVYRQGHDDGRECLTLKLFDVETSELKSEVTVIPWMSSSEFSSKGYEGFKSYYLGTTLYIYVNDKIYAVDTKTMAVKDYGAELVAKYRELSAGIAKVEKLAAASEVGFRIHSNDGLDYNYFPLQQKMYAEKEYNAARYEPKTEYRLTTIYTFKGSERQELMKQEVLMDPTGPNGNCSDCEKQATPFTPNRVYFDGDVPYTDLEHVVIAYKTDAGDKTGRVVQCLDKAGNIKWTTPAINFAVKQWKYPFNNDSRGFVLNNVLCLNAGISAVGIDMTSGKVLWQHYFSEDVFRESVK